MSRLFFIALGLTLSLTAFAQNARLKGFQERFTLVKNAEGKITAIKLKKVVSRFSIAPFIEQIKSDLLGEQAALTGLTAAEREQEIERLVADLGGEFKGDSEEAQKVREALLNIPNINVEAAFADLSNVDFWKEFEAKLNEAFLFIDPTVLANLEDPRFFYKRNVTYKVVEWALKEAQKRFANIPVLNIASFVIIRVHDMMLEQRHFHHNMLLHYFETVSETELGMTKEEVDRAVSSIYEYRIDVTNIFDSNRAAQDWLNFGMDRFFQTVRAGNARVREWQGPFTSVNFQNIKKINFAFAEVSEDNAKKIYHLHLTGHMFTQKPALAYDYSDPKKVKRNRALLNIAGVALGFIQLPGWLKASVDNFMKSFYVEQVRMEGALVGYFESTGNTGMVDKIYAQRANFYIVR